MQEVKAGRWESGRRKAFIVRDRQERDLNWVELKGVNA